MRTVLIMAIIALSFILYITIDGKDISKNTVNQNALFLPALFKEIDKIIEINIQDGKDKLVLSKVEEQWIVKSAADYPANVSVIKQLLLNLTEIKILRIKSNQQPQHRNLGVNPLGEEGKERLQITIFNESKKIKEDFIFKKKFHEKNRTFMRSVRQNEVYETEGQLDLSTDNIKWLDANLINIPSDKISSITVERTNENFTLNRKKNSPIYFEVSNLDKRLVEKSATFTSALAAFLESLRFNDVKKKSLIENADVKSRHVFFLSNMNEHVEIIDYETKFGIFTEFNLSDSLSISSNYDYTKPELLEKFVFLLPKYKRRLLEKRISDLTKKRESK